MQPGDHQGTDAHWPARKRVSADTGLQSNALFTRAAHLSCRPLPPGPFTGLPPALHGLLLRRRQTGPGALLPGILCIGPGATPEALLLCLLHQLATSHQQVLYVWNAASTKVFSIAYAALYMASTKVQPHGMLVAMAHHDQRCHTAPGKPGDEPGTRLQAHACMSRTAWRSFRDSTPKPRAVPAVKSWQKSSRGSSLHPCIQATPLAAAYSFT